MNLPKKMIEIFFRPPIVALVFLCAVLAVNLSFFLTLRDTRAILRFRLLKSLRLDVKGELIFSKIDLFFRFCVILISIRVILFRSTYIQGDPNLKYFTIIVIIFVISINFLIYIPHMIILLLG